MGFDTRSLRYAIVLAPRASKESNKLRTIVADIVDNINQGKILIPLENDYARVFINTFKIEELGTELEHDLLFWLDQRTPIPTTKAAKCKACPFNDVCQFLTHSI